ncbi:Copper Transporter integral membrane protein that functions in high affinity copper transport [Parahypoxylon ruwenzoriense]
METMTDMSMPMSMPMSMSASTGAATATATSAAAATTSAMSMDMGMDMGMGGDNSCKISMLWNWNTVDACFISSSWHIKTHGMFAGSCIGVILLAIVLEVLRRAVKEYDRYLIRKHTNRGRVTIEGGNGSPGPINCRNTTDPSSPSAPLAGTAIVDTGYTPRLNEQAVRALLHTAQFAVAYFLMLYVYLASCSGHILSSYYWYQTYENWYR